VQTLYAYPFVRVRMLMNGHDTGQVYTVADSQSPGLSPRRTTERILSLRGTLTARNRLQPSLEIRCIIIKTNKKLSYCRGIARRAMSTASKRKIVLKRRAIGEGHSRSSEMARFDRQSVTFYYRSVAITSPLHHFRDISTFRVYVTRRDCT